jgi:hypothetical protein
MSKLAATSMTSIHYRKADVDGFKVFYREAGPPRSK